MSGQTVPCGKVVIFQRSVQRSAHWYVYLAGAVKLEVYIATDERVYIKVVWFNI